MMGDSWIRLVDEAMSQLLESAIEGIDLSRAWTIKICGVTTAADAMTAIAAGADAIGLNFHPGSPRYVAPARAQEIAAAIGSRAVKVGVFVNRAVEEICELRDLAQLDSVQLHGDEQPEFVAALTAALRQRIDSKALGRCIHRSGVSTRRFFGFSQAVFDGLP